MTNLQVLLKSTLLQGTDFKELDEYLGLAEANSIGVEASRTLGSTSSRDTQLLTNILLLGIVNQNNKLSSAVSALRTELATLKEAVAVTPKAVPLPSDPLIVQKLDTLIGRTSIPPPTPQVPHRPTPPAKPAQPRATPTHARVVRSAPNPPNPPSNRAVKAAAAPAPGSTPKAKPLPSAHRRLFATRTTPGPIANAERLSASLPRLFGHALARCHQIALVTPLTVTINNRGTVSVTAPPTVPSSVYAPSLRPSPRS